MVLHIFNMIFQRFIYNSSVIINSAMELYIRVNNYYFNIFLLILMCIFENNVDGYVF